MYRQCLHNFSFQVFLTKKFGEGGRNERIILVDDAIEVFRARLGTATLDEFDDDLRPYARRAEKDFFSGCLAEENCFRVGMWFDTDEDYDDSASNPDPTIREKKVRHTPKVTRPKTNVNTPGLRDPKPKIFHQPPPQSKLSDTASRVQRSILSIL